MGRLAIHPSAALAKLMKERRLEMGLSLRDVQKRSEEVGTPIPYATLAKVEQGRVDPGVKRLHALLRLYDLPVQLAADLLEVEAMAGDLPPKSVPYERLHKDGIDHWNHGRFREGMACLLAMRERQPPVSTPKAERQRALLGFAIAATNLGKVRVAHQIIENLLVDDPVPELIVNVLVQGATCWFELGAPEAALGFLAQAETYLTGEDHKKRAWVYHGRGRVLFCAGRLDEADLALADAFEAYERAGLDYGRCQVLGNRIDIRLQRELYQEALVLIEQGRAIAEEHGFDRLRELRLIHEGRARFALGTREVAVALLQEALGSGLKRDDHIVAFQAHHALWKAFDAMGEARRAELELKSAEYYARFADYTSAEVREVREATGRKTKPAGATRRAG